jgi:hypothetical protein
MGNTKNTKPHSFSGRITFCGTDDMHRDDSGDVHWLRNESSKVFQIRMLTVPRMERGLAREHSEVCREYCSMFCRSQSGGNESTIHLEYARFQPW